ncbi:MAG: hypothetical protein QF570_08655 [Myxococcota bacterium]|nr:hypothetical protein [Myxococcota bacterium]
MAPHEAFEKRLRELINGEREVEWDFNEFVGHADVVRQLVEVAPDEIREDLEFLHKLMADARDTTASAVLGIFPRLTDPELAGVEGRISDYIAEHCGIRYGKPEYVVGRTVGESRCPAWPGVGTPLTNNRFPYLIDTSASNYFSNRFWHGDGAPPGFIPVPEGGRVVFKGEYPYARYFAFHPSDMDTNNLETIVDIDLDPDEGSVNPFREAQAEGKGRRFTAQLVFTEKPENPEPNTTYAGVKVNGGRNPAVFCIYRTTGSDFGTMPPNIGGVNVPSVTVYDADGNQTVHYDEMEPHPEGSEPPYETTHFAPLPIPDHRGLCWPEKYSTKPNWGLPYDILASADILYLVTPYTNRLGRVHVTRGRKFSAPNTPQEPVHTPGMDIRGFTVTTYNFWAGICEDAVIDVDIPVDENGYYTIVVSTSADRPANATKENGVAWLDWGEYLDGQLTFRMLLSRDEKLVQLKHAIDTGEVADEIAAYVPQSRHCSKEAFEEKGWKAGF